MQSVVLNLWLVKTSSSFCWNCFFCNSIFIFCFFFFIIIYYVLLHLRCYHSRASQLAFVFVFRRRRSSGSVSMRGSVAVVVVN